MGNLKIYKLCTHQSPLGFDERPVLAVHLVVEATSVAEIVTIAVPSPQRSGGRATVHTLATLCKYIGGVSCLKLFD